MAKPTKYPKKFRMKLEKIAAARDEREAKAAGKPTEEDDSPPSVVFWHDFLRRDENGGRAAVAIGYPDNLENPRQMRADNVIDPEKLFYRIRRVHIAPHRTDKPAGADE
jgi:hypothetical protein